MTPDQAGRIATALGPHTAAVNEVAARYDINTPKRLAAFLAQFAYESGGFTRSEENLNYSASRLRAIFRKYYPTDAAAKRDERRPERIANRVYGGRFGNTAPGDGYLYRGRSWAQLTLKDNYAECSMDLFGDQRLLVAPDSVAQMPLCVEVPAWYWQKHGCNELADQDEFEQITRRINGGLHGHDDYDRSDLDSRVDWWIRCKLVLCVDDSSAPPPLASGHADRSVAVPEPVLPESMRNRE